MYSVDSVMLPKVDSDHRFSVSTPDLSQYGTGPRLLSLLQLFTILNFMALEINTLRQFRSLSELTELVEAISTAPATVSEPDWLEWKREADFSDRRWYALIAKFVAGFANRDPVEGIAPPLSAVSCVAERRGIRRPPASRSPPSDS